MRLRDGLGKETLEYQPRDAFAEVLRVGREVADMRHMLLDFAGTGLFEPPSAAAGRLTVRFGDEIGTT